MADDNNSNGTTDHVAIEITDLQHDNKRIPQTPFTSSAVPSREQRDEEFDQEMLHKAIADTGRWAYGTISVEAWVLDDTTGKLIRPPKAYWVDPVYILDNAKNEALLRLTDHSRPDFVRPDPLSPGIGLPGTLWSELSHNNLLDRGTSRRGIKNLSTKNRIAWRRLEEIRNDPDQPYNLRLQLAVKAGIGLAAGVNFQFPNGTQGLVLYMARGTTDTTKLKSQSNTQYLLSSADVIGSIISLRKPRRICMTERRAEREDVRRRVRLKMIAFITLGGSFLRHNTGVSNSTALSNEASEQTKQSTSQSTKRSKEWSIWKSMKSKIKQMTTKWKGAGNQIPPPFSNTESIWTFGGCFVTLLMLLAYSDAISNVNSAYSLVTGPFGALMTLQYSLTAAPASQPRNALLGQTIALAIALGITYTSITINLKKAIGTSLAICIMARLGITHPPAGASAMLFSGGDYSWIHMAIMLGGNVIAILAATVINDMNDRRQYPTTWGLGYWHKHFWKRSKEA